jgi:Mce-associated membrane protein
MTTTNHDTMTGSELSVPIDSDSVTDGSPPGPEQAPARGDAADHDERSDVCDEAEAADLADHADATDEADHAEAAEAAKTPTKRTGRFSWKRILAHGVLPALALILAMGAAYLKWQAGAAELSRAAAPQSTQAATETTIAMLSYRSDTVDKDLRAAANRLTSKFRDEYTQLINDVVIPGAKQKKISSVASVPAAASVSATENHAVVLVFVNQTINIGDDPPSDSASSVRVTLDKINNRWLISHFDPV